jgi:hypothetical protein
MTTSLRMMQSTLFLATVLSLCATSALAEECNIANVLFGKVRIELIPHKEEQRFKGYETGIVFGADFDSKRFSYDKILGRISPPERDGSRRISDVSGEPCGEITQSMQIVPEDCQGCAKGPYALRRVTNSSYVVLHPNGSILGTVEGRLPGIIEGRSPK